jgi:hypothetical protein
MLCYNHVKQVVYIASCDMRSVFNICTTSYADQCKHQVF